MNALEVMTIAEEIADKILDEGSFESFEWDHLKDIVYRELVKHLLEEE